MKNCFLLICCAFIAVFATRPAEIIIRADETRVLRDMTFEGFSGDFVIKNYGTLTVENSVFRKNVLGNAATDGAEIGVEKVVAPIINFGKLIVESSEFTNNFSRNVALTESFVSQPAAGAVANFGKLILSGENVFTDNMYQHGNFVIIRNEGVQRVAYLGNDDVFNRGTVEILSPQQEQEQNRLQNTLFTALIMENPVSTNARIRVNTNSPTSVTVTVLSNTGNVVFSTQAQVQDSRIFEWNLMNQAGQRVLPEQYLVRVQAGNFTESMPLGVRAR